MKLTKLDNLKIRLLEHAALIIHARQGRYICCAVYDAADMLEGTRPFTTAVLIDKAKIEICEYIQKQLGHRSSLKSWQEDQGIFVDNDTVRAHRVAWCMYMIERIKRVPE
jgi:hypothetical protein